ncbi:hypothetical protein A6E13_16195 [Aliivibrio fischeri]|uniref:hypothetical protein n=1 Tax=Aliivibrio fischeri TaxID=668 RepID=UPI00080E6504|nr:hypothetical protein [Aliivibrio fischeri]OCH31883.1 hypothetical protein A6E13_16195 [Aliivibrio fischeri]
MAYIIKSDVAVEDPNGRFPYFTRFGITHPDIKNYMDNLESVGYLMNKKEFDGLNRFIRTLESRSLWINVLEVYPFIGNSIASATIKLKPFKLTQLSVKNTSTSASLSLKDNWDITPDGNVIGIKNNREYQETYTSCFDTGLVVDDLNQDWGFSAYVLDTEIVNTPDRSHSLFGASLDEFAQHQVLVEYRNWNDVGIGGCLVSASNRSGRGYGNIPLDYVPGGRVLQFTCDRSELMALSGDTTVLDVTAPSYTYPKSEERPIYLLSKSPFSGGIMQGFNGGMRFAMVENKSSRLEDKKIINQAIVDLMTDLGKNWGV